MSKTERYAHPLFMACGVTPKDAVSNLPSHSFDEILGVFKSSYDAGNHFLVLPSSGGLPAFSHAQFIVPKKGQKIENDLIFISDYKIDSVNNRRTIVITKADGSSANPAFIDPITGSVRLTSPEGDEKQGFSTHIVIDTNKTKTASGSVFNKVVIDRVHGVSKTTALGYLDVLLSRYSTEKGLSFKTGPKAKDRSYRIRLDYTSKGSKKLKEALKERVVSSVELYDTEAEFAGMNNAPEIRRVEKKLVIKLADVDESMRQAFLNKLPLKAKDEGFDDIRYRFKGEGTGNRLPRFTIEQADAQDTLFSRLSKMTDFAEDLQQCYSQVSTDLEKKLIKELGDNENWT